MVNAQDQPVPDMVVRSYREGFRRSMGMGTAATTDEDGRFEIELPEGCRVDLETGTYGRGAASSFADTGRTEPVRLLSVESNAQDVELRIDG